MPQKLERKLKRKAKKRGLSKKRTAAYVSGKYGFVLQPGGNGSSYQDGTIDFFGLVVLPLTTIYRDMQMQPVILPRTSTLQ